MIVFRSRCRVVHDLVADQLWHQARARLFHDLEIFASYLICYIPVLYHAFYLLRNVTRKFILHMRCAN